MSVLGALGYGLINVFHPRMLWLMVWPMLVALAVWGTIALVTVDAARARGSPS